MRLVNDLVLSLQVLLQILHIVNLLSATLPIAMQNRGLEVVILNMIQCRLTISIEAGVAALPLTCIWYLLDVRLQQVLQHTVWRSHRPTTGPFTGNLVLRNNVVLLDMDVKLAWVRRLKVAVGPLAHRLGKAIKVFAIASRLHR